MTARSTRTRAASLAPLLALALAGCGAGGSDGGADDDDAGTAPAVPFDAYFERAYGDADADRDLRRVEELVAECMTGQGFDYTPVDPAAQGAGGMRDQDELGFDWGTLEFARQYGYAITTDPFSVPEDAQARAEAVDPNADYVAAMSEPERAEYYVALYGRPDDPSQEATDDWQPAGCRGDAHREVYEAALRDPSVASLEEEMYAVLGQAEQDPRLSEVTVAWSDCMADRGVTGLTAVTDASTRISDKAIALHEEVYAEGEPVTAVPTAQDQAAFDARYRERLSELTEEEIETAVADFECRAEVGLDDALHEVSVELQEEFIETHRDELEAWVEAASDAS